MGSFTSEVGGADAAYSNERRAENLGLAFQEVLTAIVRLRTNRQVVTDPEQFRGQMREALKAADHEARNRGYSAEQIKLAVFAAVAFLDESVLNLQQPVFAQWPRKPLQEELFGVHVAGEIFFRNIERLLGMRDSHDLADVLEVYELCLLLGFRGKYGLGGQAELRAVIESVRDKMRRIRGRSGELSPSWAIPPGTVTVTLSDPWLKRLLWIAIACVALVIILFVVFKLSLNAGASDLKAVPAPRIAFSSQPHCRRSVPMSRDAAGRVPAPPSVARPLVAAVSALVPTLDGAKNLLVAQAPACVLISGVKP